MIWQKKDPYVPGTMVLVIETTSPNQKVNLGYNLGRWENTDKAAKKIPTKGTITWEEGGESTPFIGTEGIEEEDNPLVHTYENAGTYEITIKGVVRWNRVYNIFGTATSNSIQEALKKIEIPEGEISPIYFIDEYAFYSCKKLESIPGNLFENCAQVTKFNFSFMYCTQLTKIPIGLFDHCTQATSFNGCFERTKITEIPQGLFDNCPLVTSFSSSFRDSKITEIPQGLFDNCPLVTSFNECFYHTRLTTIPQGLFDLCTQAANFYGCFWTVPITSIPYNLFYNNKTVGSFDYTFYNCYAVEGELPPLWETHPQVTRHIACFWRCTKATNYQDAVDAGWT